MSLTRFVPCAYSPDTEHLKKSGALSGPAAWVCCPCVVWQMYFEAEDKNPAAERERDQTDSLHFRNEYQTEFLPRCICFPFRFRLPYGIRRMGIAAVNNRIRHFAHDLKKMSARIMPAFPQTRKIKSMIKTKPQNAAMAGVLRVLIFGCGKPELFGKRAIACAFWGGFHSTDIPSACFQESGTEPKGWDGRNACRRLNDTSLLPRPVLSSVRIFPFFSACGGRRICTALTRRSLAAGCYTGRYIPCACRRVRRPWTGFGTGAIFYRVSFPVPVLNPCTFSAQNSSSEYSFPLHRPQQRHPAQANEDGHERQTLRKRRGSA